MAASGLLMARTTILAVDCRWPVTDFGQKWLQFSRLYQPENNTITGVDKSQIDLPPPVQHSLKARAHSF
jgi:hypothetical protein